MHENIHASVDVLPVFSSLFFFGMMCVMCVLKCDWVCVKYSMHLFCLALIRGMEDLRSALKATLSWRNSRQIKLSGSWSLTSGFETLSRPEPFYRAGNWRKVTEMGIFKLIIFPQLVQGDNSCHVSYSKHVYRQSPSLVSKCQHFSLNCTSMDFQDVQAWCKYD